MYRRVRNIRGGGENPRRRGRGERDVLRLGRGGNGGRGQADQNAPYGVDGNPPRGRGNRRGDDRGGSRNRGNRGEDVVRPMGFKKMQELVDDEEISPRELVIKLASERSGFYQRLKTDMDGGMRQMVLQVCGKVCMADGARQFQLEILNQLLTNNFAEKMTGFLAGLPDEMGSRRRQTPKHIKNCLLLMKAWQDCIPKTTRKEITMLLLIVKTVTEQVGAGEEMNIAKLIKEIQTRHDETQQNNAPGSNWRELRQLQLNELHNHAPPNNFRGISVFPTVEDINTTEDPFVRTNLVNGAYSGQDHYLDVQFRLLREDFVRPLREGIESFISNSTKTRHSRQRQDNVKVYQNVKIEFPYPSNKGVHYVIHFSTESLQKIRWENTKRFLFGNLICLSNDHFKDHFMFATVTDRDPSKLALGYLMVEFVQKEDDMEMVEESSSSDEDEDLYDDDVMEDFVNRALERRLRRTHLRDPIDMKQTYTMVETEAFFESYRHVLAGLQETENVPLARYLVECNMEMQPPPYLLRNHHDFDLSPIQNPDLDKLEKIDILNLDKWPTCEELSLDESQRHALQIALTNELALIQGPPGTGKTYVGLKVMRILLANSKKSLEPQEGLPGQRPRPPVEVKHPILVVCYTNHALDQFLEGISQFHEEGIVRVGGRCKNKNLEKYMLNQKRRNERFKSSKTLRAANWNKRSELDNLRSLMKSDGEKLEGSTNCIINLKQLKSVIPEHLFVQLFYNGDSEWQSKSNSDDMVLLDWLGVGLKQNSQNESYVYRAFLSHFTRQFTDIGFNLDLVHYAINQHGINPHVIHFWLRQNQNFRITNIVQVKPDIVSRFLQTIPLPGPLLHLIQVYNYDPLEVQCAVFCTNAADINGLMQWLQRHSSQEQGSETEENDEILMPEEAELIQDQRILDGTGVEVNEQFKNQVREKNKVRDKEIKREIAAATYTDIEGKTSEDGWSITPEEKKRRKNQLKKELGKTDAMSKRDAAKVEDIFSLEQENRWKLYRRWVDDWKDGLRSAVERHTGRYNTVARQLMQLRDEEDLNLLEQSDVIGMTTSGAARYRAIVQQLKTKVVIVEEAAEVLEAHIVTAMPKTTEHLILIGDHQQLKPSPTVYLLARDYQLDISLFERMINNKIPCAKLAIQHRMKPDIADLIRPNIYENLLDHESVLRYEEISGVSKSVFFISHEIKEDTVMEGKTKVNNFEAKYMVALCKHLMLQEYKPTQITILTTYTGQLFAFKKIMKEKLFQGVHVTAVDNYQGEENDIILLSLVRSNDEGKIGFLKVSNRVCVALSRAKKGLFCIGNLELLQHESELWRNIVSKLKLREMCGPALTLQCKNHPETTIKAETSEDFDKFPEGGCGRLCEYRLSCGHVCTRSCHPDDQDHTNMKCRKPCPKNCTKGHRCKKKCSDDCGNCMERVEKMVPMCCHIEKMPCYKDPAEHTCTKPCSKILSCEHTCSNVCGVNCVTECLEKVTVNLACGHESKVVCHLSKDPDKSLCSEQCNEQLQCGHLCKGTCSKCMQGRLHEKCGKKCTRTLFCGHQCRESCSVNCPPCTRPCETRCEHSKCKKNCLEPCTLCTEKCEWRCAHFKCGKLCSEPCDRPPCNEPCDKVLKCNHVCIGLCGEPCPKLCRICDKEKVTEILFGDEDEPDARFVELPECGHVFTYEGLDKWMGMHQDDKSDDGEDANIQLKKCPRCSTPIRGARRYGEVINDQLRAINKVKERSHGTKSEIAIATRALSAKVNGKEGNECHFKENIAGLRKRLESKPKSMSALKVIEHQYSGLCALSAVQIKIKKYIHIAGGMVGSTYSAIQDDPKTLFQKVRDDISHIHSWLMKPRSRFSEQEIEDFAKEEKRIRQGYFFVVILDNFNKNKLNLPNGYVARPHIKNGIQILFHNFAPYEGKNMADVKRALEEIKRHEPALLENGKLSKSEKEMIVKAMGLSKGHWYKCKKGHIYCITECGGATEQGVCPECKGVIGGSGHRLHEDNAVATEMDGATRPAYDPMNNYIPPEY